MSRVYFGQITYVRSHSVSYALIKGGMMKGYFCCLSVLIFLFCGCAAIEEKPEMLITDSNFSRFQQKKADIESAYLGKEISYSEYQMKLGELEHARLKSEQEREEILFK